MTSRRFLWHKLPRVSSITNNVPASLTTLPSSSSAANCSSWSSHNHNHNNSERPSWSDEWKQLGLGAQLVDQPVFPNKLMFVQCGFGVDQHGQDDATKAATRAVRNAIEFNSIPGVIEHIPGGRKEMMIHVKLGVPSNNQTTTNQTIMYPLDVLQVAKVFPYGKLLPIQVVQGGLEFATGRVVEELGDTHDRAICVAACISVGYGNPTETNNQLHTTYNTKDGY